MSLLEILKTRAGKEIGAFPSKKPEKELPKSKQEEELSLEISYNRIETPDEELFFLSWAPFLRSPLAFDFTIHRDFSDFLLEGKAYTINLFIPLDGQRIFNLYSQLLSLHNYKDIQKLCFFCWNLELRVPAFYQERIESFIKQEFSNEKRTIRNL